MSEDKSNRSSVNVSGARLFGLASVMFICLAATGNCTACDMDKDYVEMALTEECAK
jgi:hypothetical protein